MASDLRSELRQKRPFATPEQEAYLSLGRTWAFLEHGFTEAFQAYGITPTQYNVLRILRGAGPEGRSRHEIRDRLVARVPDVTRLLDRLEKRGWVERRRDAHDRRLVSARITPSGLELLAELDEPVLDLHRAQFAGWEPAELRTLIRALARVRQGG